MLLNARLIYWETEEDIFRSLRSQGLRIPKSRITFSGRGIKLFKGERGGVVGEGDGGVNSVRWSVHGI